MLLTSADCTDWRTLMRVLLTSLDFCSGYELTPANKRMARKYEKESGNESRLITSDWDFPSLARDLGWNMRIRGTKQCEHRSTDGTVTCRECGTTATQFIEAAQAWLDKRVDTVIQQNTEAIQMYFYID